MEPSHGNDPILYCYHVPLIKCSYKSATKNVSSCLLFYSLLLKQAATTNDRKRPQTTSKRPQTTTNNHKRRANECKSPQTTTNHHKRPQTTTNDHKPPANDHKPPANDHKSPQTTTNHQQTTTIKIKPNKTFPNFNYLFFFVNWKHIGA